MNTNEIIREFIMTEILHGSRKEPLGDQDSLIESGIIDSLGIMTILAFLDEKFSVQVPGEDLIPENFDSIATLSALVERQKVPERG
jgi:acyl carrier protein